MADCRLCKHARLREGHSPHEMKRLPVEVTQYHLFKRKSTPVTLCPECDGRALELALENHRKRLATR